MTIHNLGSKTDLLSIHNNAVVSATGAGTPANVDLVDYEGDVAFIIDAAAAGSGVTLTAKIQHSNSNDLRRYVRVLFTVTGGSGTGAVSVQALGSKKYS
jgi:hypothetical protein